MVAKGFPFLVAEVDGKVVGYSYANSYRARSAYRFTVENSIYVSKDAKRQNIGKHLMQALIEACKDRGYREIISVIAHDPSTMDSVDDNPSIVFHSKFGFEYKSILNRVGYKFGRWLDTVIMQKSIP
jgi:L-amino acid N-acyltransferase YncA